MSEFDQYVVEVGMEMSDKELADVIQYWLDNDDKRIGRRIIILSQ